MLCHCPVPVSKSSPLSPLFAIFPLYLGCKESLNLCSCTRAIQRHSQRGKHRGLFAPRRGSPTGAWSVTTGTGAAAADDNAMGQLQSSRAEGQTVDARKCSCSDFRIPIPNQDNPVLPGISWRSERTTQFLSSTSLLQTEEDELHPYPLQASYFLWQFSSQLFFPFPQPSPIPSSI